MAPRSHPGSLTTPVRWVRFTLFFNSDLPPRSADLADFIQHFRAEYPVVSEDPPLASFKKREPSVEFLGRGAPWPLPFTQMENPETGRKLIFQSDRVGVSWHFDAEASDMKYPGFDELSAIAHDAFEKFQESLGESGCEIVIRGAECHYENLLTGLSAHDYVVSRLGGVQGGADRRAEGIDLEEFSFDAHFHEGDNEPVWVEVLPDADGTQLTITTRCEDDAAEADQRADLARVLLDRAHDHATLTYDRWGSISTSGEAENA